MTEHGKMRRSRKKLVVISMFVIAFGGLGIWFIRLCFFSSSSGESLRSMILGNSTVYAKGFSESKFRAIDIGMNEAQVEAIMGSPLQKGPWGGLTNVWRYSDQETVTDNFHRRWVVFKDGKVEFLLHDFWVD